MDDCELLEAAAKAAGKQFNSAWRTSDNGQAWATISVLDHEGKIGTKLWNPLQNDAAALQLAMKLNICLIFMEDNDSVGAEHSRHGVIIIEPLCEEGVRRAITRCAAEIGKSMEKSQ